MGAVPEERPAGWLEAAQPSGSPVPASELQLRLAPARPGLDFVPRFEPRCAPPSTPGERPSYCLGSTPARRPSWASTLRSLLSLPDDWPEFIFPICLRFRENMSLAVFRALP